MHAGHYMFMFLSYIFIWIITIIMIKVSKRNCPDTGYCGDGLGTMIILSPVIFLLMMIPSLGIPLYLIYSFVKLFHIESTIVSGLLTVILCLVIIPIIAPFEFISTVYVTAKLSGAN